MSAKQWKDLNRRIEKCRLCPGLNIPRHTMSAPGYGDRDALIMFIGQSLHAYNPETPVQIPFVGPQEYDSGNILFEALEYAGLKYEDVFTTNTIHCHPQNNRPSTDEEMRNCSAFLLEEIRLVRPRAIITLGKQAHQNLIRLGFKLQYEEYKIASNVFEGIPLVTAWSKHPAYALRQGRGGKEHHRFVEKLGTLLKTLNEVYNEH